jgi:ferredoxin-NADP reductase
MPELRAACIRTAQPPADWTGERGRITAVSPQRESPDDLARWDFFICGAHTAVDSGIAAIGVPPERVHAERFVEI